MLTLAIELATKLEHFLIDNDYKMHVGLTGGVLYKEGVRKDIDLLVYNVLQSDIKEDNAFVMLQHFCQKTERTSFESFYGFVTKITYKGHNIDILYPEFIGVGTYPVDKETSNAQSVL